MPMPFKVDEIFKMAEQIERNGAKFYRAAAKKIPAAKQALVELASMEDEHLRTFAAIIAEEMGHISAITRMLAELKP
jgi:rubrerythrin